LWCHDNRELITRCFILFETYCRFVQVGDEPVFSFKKLEALGWKFKPFEETLRDSVESYRAKDVLD
jgi:hypothetical protein